MPGLINTHTHAPMVLYRGLADDLALMDWLQKYIFPSEAQTVSPEFVRAGTRLAALEMIQSGTTTYADMYYFEEEIARATRDAGLRGVLGQTIIQFPVPDAKTPQDGMARAERFIKAYASDELITPAIAPHAMYTLDRATLRSIRAIADREHAPVIIHLAETQDEVRTARQKYQLDPDRFPRVDRLLGTEDHCRPCGVGHAGGHPNPRPPPRRGVAQPREQHEARQRDGAGDRDARRRARRRLGH